MSTYDPSQSGITGSKSITGNNSGPKPSQSEAEEAVRTLIRWAGDDPLREGLIETPWRVVKAYRELFRGYDEDHKDILAKIFQDVSQYSDMVLIKNIRFYSHCEHHLVPFYGYAHIAYFPSNGVVGLSKIARVVNVYARRLQTQESMTMQIANAINESLRPKGLAILIQAEHMCMSMRGINKAGSETHTSNYSGIFAKEEHQERFIAMLR